jgi:TetR/AcrR family transcriptional regulator, fatty acid metabolism regulator protein
MGIFIEKIEEEIRTEQSAAEKLYTLIDKHFSLLAEDHHLAIVTQLELRQSNKELRLRINEVLKGYFNVVDKIITSGQEAGEFREDLDLRLTRQMIFGTIDEIVTTWVMNDQKYNLTKQVKQVHELFVYGFVKS